MSYNSAKSKSRYKICVIGSEALIFPFLQFGFSTYTPASEKELRNYVQNAIDLNYGIIYIEDSFCFKVEDIIEKQRENLTPIFVPIGNNESGESYSKLVANRLMEKAIGINVI
jgi:vacuolar-type H+-ATPase subunit F/Vma7